MNSTVYGTKKKYIPTQLLSALRGSVADCLELEMLQKRSLTGACAPAATPDRLEGLLNIAEMVIPILCYFFLRFGRDLQDRLKIVSAL